MNAQNRSEGAAIRHEVDHLRHKTVTELKVRYAELFGEASRSNHKQFLVRRIAWKIQAVAEGDLSQRARDCALRLARDADLRLRAPQGASTMTTAGRHRDFRLPAPGTILKRTFRDQSVMVRVLESGFEYEGAVHRSLSAIARHVSGTHWNGFSFFGLHSTAASEDLETNFLMTQSVLRIARNDAGRPTASKLQREQVYVNLQLFIPFARQLMRLRAALA